MHLYMSISEMECLVDDLLNTSYLIISLAEVSFIALFVTKDVTAPFQFVGLFMIVIFLILKCLGACDGDDHNSNVTVDTYRTSNAVYRTSNAVVAQERTETEPMMHVKPNPMTHRTNEDHDDESDASSSSSEELYDEKLCVICYDEQRNCFFVPCGHCATCYDCAKRYILQMIFIYLTYLEHVWVWIILENQSFF